MINKDRKFIYIHIPKTAGTSVENCLRNTGKFYSGGSTHEKLKKIYNPDFFIFTFVRNPYDRIHSIWNYFKQGGNKSSSDIIIQAKTPNKFIDFCHIYIKNKREYYENWLDDQFTFIEINGEIKTDFIGRFENLQKDYKKIQEKLNLKYDLPHLRRISHNLEYNEEAKKIIQLRYIRDYNYFNY